MSIYVPPRPSLVPLGRELKAGPIGPGAGVLLTEFPLNLFIGQSQQRKMQTAYKIGMEVPWVRKAEGVIASRLSTVPFTLEDPNDDAIDDDYADPNAVMAFDLLSKPQGALTVGQPLTRSQLWRLTSRHTGLCGNGFWLKDEMNAFGIPRAHVYIRPDRMSPNEDANGNLRSWQIDKTPQQPGIEVSLEQVLHFMLEPPDEGHFGPGLVETWLLRAKITTALDQQLAQVLQSGGRITGILSPKAGSIEPGSDTAVQMERDWRTITEQPDAARRLQIVYAPVDFQKTTLSMDELKIVELMKLMRDDGLAFWGVPPSMAGVPAAAGLNSGDTRQYDEAALWQGPVHDRLVIFGELLQDQQLDNFEGLLGWAPQLIINEPSFDDEAPRYDLATKAVNVALTDDERRGILGKDPLPNGLGNVVRLPMTMVEAFAVPPENEPQVTVAPVGINPPEVTTDNSASLAAGETAQPKARGDTLRQTLVTLRTRLQANLTPRLRDSLRSFLAAQKAEIAAKVGANYDHIRSNPRDTSVWFDKAKWDKGLRETLGQPLASMAQTIDGHIAATFAAPVKADPVERILTRGAARITGINDTTRAAVQAILAANIEAGGTAQDAMRALDDLTEFDEARAELIARTELMDAYNGAALGAYGDAGIREVQAIDGDQDEECAARDGQTFSIDEADGIEDHPNGTLDWVPVLEPVEVPVKVPVKALAVAPKPDPVAPLSQSFNIAPPDMNPIAQAIITAIREGFGALPVPQVHIEPPSISVEAPNVSITSPENVVNLPETVVHVAAPVVNVPAAQVNVAAPDLSGIADLAAAQREGTAEIKATLMRPKTVRRSNRTGEIEGVE